MRIKNDYQNQTFKHLYIDMRSLNTIYQNKPIIRALKEQNTPLRKFIKEVINTEKFEKDMGDCFIKLSHERYPVEGLTFVDMDIIKFLFPKKQEQARRELFNQLDNLEPNPRFEKYEEKIRVFMEKWERAFIAKQIPDLAEKESSFCTMFEDGDCIFSSDYPNPTHKELVNYIKSSKIVEDLKKRIEYIFNNI